MMQPASESSRKVLFRVGEVETASVGPCSSHTSRNESEMENSSQTHLAEPPPVFNRIEPVLTTSVSDMSRAVAITLLVTANLIQFISNFLTLSGGITLTHALGRETGPGKANWMAASYSLTQGALSSYLAGSEPSTATSDLRSLDWRVRALSGVGGGIYMPNAIIALGLMVPPGQTRNLLYGLFAAAPPLGGLTGALLAGLCANWQGLWSWTVLFGSLGIISALSYIFLVLILPHERPVDPSGKIDVIGACLGLSGLLLFNVAMGQAPSVGWSSPYEIALLFISVLIFSLFLVWEHYFASQPIMPLAVFRVPTFLALIFVVLFSYMAFGIALWYSISWQQVLRQLSVLQIGVNFIPFGIGSTAAVGLAVFLLPRIEARFVMGIGVVVVIGASPLLATMPMHQTYWAQVFPAMLLCGCCPDFVYLAAQVIASNSVNRKHQGIASSLVGTLNLYGVSLGLGFAGTIEVEVGKKARQLGGKESLEGIMTGFKAALYFSAALAFVGLLLDFAFVKVPKVDRPYWGEEDTDEIPLEEPNIAVRNTGSTANVLAIVTGASKQNGIGFATAYALAKAGADIVIHYNSNKSAAEQSLSQIQALGVKAVAVQSDAGSLAFGEDIINATTQAFPGRSIDIIVNNAGHATFQESVETAPVEEFDSLFHPNVRGPHVLTKAALPLLASPGGRIINIGSVVARTGTKFATMYSASKAALNALTLAWAEELGDRGITVNVVAPGPIDTDYAPPEDHPLTKKFRAQQYTKRDGTPEEIANVVVFIASAGSSFVNGQVLGVDGGLSYV
ncbi:hypothetical protein PWT90_08562 [Aphanocladium album]|nr:hypothetical protein PWT90_08562 [Aphanocladium album]